jgi:hypothetical protein
MIEAKKMKGEDPCWKNYEMVGTKKKGGREVPNCVPKEELEIDEAAVGNRGLIDGRNKLADKAIDASGRKVPTHPKGLRMIPTHHSAARLPSGELKTKAANKAKKDAYYQNLRYGKGSARIEGVDFDNIIISHLLDEGYAETLEAAEVIMMNMGEEWMQTIIEAIDWDNSEIGQHTGGAIPKKKDLM